jgi:Acetyltransferase (GNAT) domain
MKTSLYAQPPPDWQALCAKYGSFCADIEWHNLLHNAFGAISFYVVSNDEERSFALQVFRVGPFKAGYINFPIGGTLGGQLPEPACIELLTRRLAGRVQLLNLVCPAFLPEEAGYPGTPVIVPETAITDLASYALCDHKKIRRDLKRAQQFGIQIRENADSSYAQSLYALYQDTVARHRGRLRYSLRYFQELVRLAEQTAWLHVFTAHLDSRIIGFLVLLLHNRGAYYLHGAIDRDYAKYGVSDVLIAHAIAVSQQQGAGSFNLMASPVDQPKLLKYKEKWGATTRGQKHFQYFSHPAWKFAYHFGNAVLNLLW